MKIARPRSLGAVVLLAALGVANAGAQDTSSGEAERRMVQRRAVDAAIWGLPIVSLHAMRQAYLRDGKAKYGDIIWWPKGSAWKNQSLTPNTNVRYLYAFLNTRDDGPMVVDLPPAAKGASLLGTVVDAWQVPLIDVGVEGKAAKYLVLPPDYTGALPDGYTPIRPKTFNTFVAIRSILAGPASEDETNGNILVNQIRIYRLAKAGSPPAQRFVDMTDTMYEGLVQYDETIYTALAAMLSEEPVQPDDRQMMGLLLPLGIEKGKEFKPDAATVGLLRAAAAEAHVWLLAKLPTFVSEFWPRSRWNLPVAPIGPKTGFKWGVGDYFDVDSRALAFASFFAPPATLGAGSFYLGTDFDSSGQPLGGENAYRLHVPANVPVSQFWSVTIYSKDTYALFRDPARPTLDSTDKGLQKNGDGSVDVYFGPDAPAGRKSNWIHTPSGRRWFPWFRFFGPEKGLFEKSWKMPDVERVE